MGLREVFSKVSAIEPEVTELASHKVDLGLVDDFTKEANLTITNGDLLKKEDEAIDKNLAAYFKLKTELATQKEKLQSDINSITIRIDNILTGYNKTSKIYQDFVNKASDLGIAYPKNIDVTFKKIEDLLKYSKSVNPKNVKL